MAEAKKEKQLDERPAAYFDKFHKRARTHDPDVIYSLARLIMVPITAYRFRREVIGADNIPLEGAALITPRHSSAWDHFLVGMCTRRPVRFMAKSEMFKPPMQFVYSHGGTFPVRRGKRDEEAMETARIVILKGDLVVMYPQATRMNEIEGAKPGIGRLMLQTGVAAIPTAVWLERPVRWWQRGRAVVCFGKPVQYPRQPGADRDKQQVLADFVLEVIKDLHRQIEVTVAL